MENDGNQSETQTTAKSSTKSSAESEAMIRRLLHRSLMRANVFQVPWPEEEEMAVVEMWASQLAQYLPVEKFPLAFRLAHETRSPMQFGKPLTLDDVIRTAKKLQASMVWNVRSDRWEPADGDFYAPPTTMDVI